MYLRFVDLRVREGQESAFTTFYRERVIPAMEEMDGCLFAGLLAPWSGKSHQSLTIWTSPQDAEAYEDSGLYDKLLKEATPMLAGTSAWRVRLSHDPLETLDPSRREPPSKGYRVEEDEGNETLDDSESSPFVRVVSIRVAPGRLPDFVELYHEQVIPALKSVDGFRGVFLAEGVDDPLGVVSISLWNREADAVRYEMSGEFERLTARLRETFSPVYGWQARLSGTGGQPAPEVSSYELVQGRRLNPGDEED